MGPSHTSLDRLYSRVPPSLRHQTWGPKPPVLTSSGGHRADGTQGEWELLVVTNSPEMRKLACSSSCSEYFLTT